MNDGPGSVDMPDIQFKRQQVFKVFTPTAQLPQYETNLLATASTFGVIFIGTPREKILVCPLSTITHPGLTETQLPHFEIPLPGIPYQIALSCDNSYLAVAVDAQDTPHIIIYVVESLFTGKNVRIVVRPSPDANVRPKQILWNPVLNNMFALCLDNGGMASYTLEGEGYNLHSLDKSENVQCACWSPKGKQIVVGFANGKLVQYKPDLKPARTIQVTGSSIPFDVIAIQWLSTYQFAAAFLNHEAEAVPSIYIINAPKNVNPVCINYFDICYSASGPRKPQVFIIHVAPWNLLLVASANSTEVGILGTLETGDAPMWGQWTMLDDSRAELPLSADKAETFPIGFSLDTGCTHHVMSGETRLPVMPMIHLLSTHGYLISFNMLNLKPSYVDICSPPRPLPAQIKWQPMQFDQVNVVSAQTAATPQKPPAQPPATTPTQAKPTDFSFSLPPNVISTSVSDNKPKSFFTPPEQTSKVSQNLFNQGNTNQQQQQNVMNPTPQQQPVVQPQNLSVAASPFGQNISGFNTASDVKPTTTLSSSPFTMSNLMKSTGQQPSTPPTLLPNPMAMKLPTPAPEPAKPLITVPPTYTKSKIPSDMQRHVDAKRIGPSPELIEKLMKSEIDLFEKELRDLIELSQTVKSAEVGTNGELQNLTRKLSELEDIGRQATESTEALTTEVHILRLGLNEAFGMVAEARSKHKMYNDPEYISLHDSASKSSTSQRQLAKLQAIIQANHLQFNEINRQYWSQCSNFEDIRKKNTKERMKIPTLEVIYQTLTTQQEILNRQHKNINFIKQKLGLKVMGKLGRSTDRKDGNIETLTDSIMSMSLADQIKSESSKLSNQKLNVLRDILKDRKVTVIQSIRPDRKSSEVIIEKKLTKEKLRERKQSGKDKTTTPATTAPLPFQQKPILVGSAANAQATPKSTTLNVNQIQRIPAKGGLMTNSNTTMMPGKSDKLPPQAFSFNPQLPPTTTIKMMEKPLVKSDEKSSGLFDFRGGATSTFGMTQQPSSGGTAAQSSFGLKTNEKPKELVMKTVPTTQPPATNIFSAAATGMSSSGVDPAKPASNIFGSLGGASNKPTTTTTTPQFSFINPGTSTSTISNPVFGGNKPIGDSKKEILPGLLAISSAPPQTPKASEFSFSMAGTSLNDPPVSQSNNLTLSSTTMMFPGLNSGMCSTPKPLDKETAVANITPVSSIPVALTVAKTETTQSEVISSTPTQTAAKPTFAGFGEIQSPSTGTTVTPVPIGMTTAIVAPIITPSSKALSSTPATVVATPSSSFSFGNAFSDASKTAAATAVPSSSASVTDPTEILSSLTICKPDVVTPKSETNIFSQIGSLISTTTTEPSSIFSSATAGKTSIFGGAQAATSAPPTTVTQTPSVFAGIATSTTTPPVSTVASPIFAQPNLATTTATGVFEGGFGAQAAISQTSTPSSPFGGGGAVTITAIPKSEPASVFGGTSVFGSTRPVPGTISVASGTPTVVSPSNIFAQANQNTPTFGTPSSNAGPVFGGGPPKSETSSIFGSATTFGAKPIESTSPFGAGGATTGSSIFGGGASATAASPFGAAATASNPGSIFGGNASPATPFGNAATTTTTQASSVFGSPVSANASGSGGSLFGSGFGTTPTAVGGSIFGGTVNQSSFGGSIGTPTTGGAFSQQKPAFGSPGTFGQPTGGSTFGSQSPGLFSQGINQGQSAFATPPAFGSTSPSAAPAFGASPTFGGPATFGTTPTFGGGATFSSPTKPTAFGNFGSPQQQATFPSPTQQNTLFEQLGSSDNAMTFGNLAQTGNNNMNKPQFDGTAFSSWR